MPIQKLKTKETFKAWLPFAVIIVIFSGLIYAAVQQNYRTGANDPQIQVAEDISTAISTGQAAPGAIVPANPTVDMTQSLSTFVIIYTATGTPIGGSVALDGKIPSLPAGVTDYTLLRGQDRFTWEPKPGVRIAAVLNHFNGAIPGFVLAGRSLKEVEIRQNSLTVMCAAGAAIALVLVLLVLLFASAEREVLYHTETTVEVVSEQKPL
jgi:hypothetical protein